MIKALLFDFDGVLALSEGPRFKAVSVIATKYGVKMDESTRVSARGKTTLAVLQELLPGKQDVITAIFDEYRSDYIENITTYVEPIAFTVNFIRNYKGALSIAIASMSSRKTIERLTKHFGIYEKIVDIVGKDDVVNHKPDPEIYLKAAADLNVNPQDCLVFEDTVIGVQSAHNANMACCVVLNGENKKEEFEGMRVHSFVASENDLVNIVEINFQRTE